MNVFFRYTARTLKKNRSRTVVTVIGTFISDVLLAWLDPRARKEYLKG